jgi:hypothetical protein
MGDAKNNVMRMIQRKMSTTRAFNKKMSSKMGLNAIILEFMQSVERTSSTSKNIMEFDDGLNRSSRLLEMRMKGLDDGVKVDILWHKEEDVAKWNELRIDSIKIIWSDDYLKKHPSTSKEYFVDVGVLMLEGMLDS